MPLSIIHYSFFLFCLQLINQRNAFISQVKKSLTKSEWVNMEKMHLLPCQKLRNDSMVRSTSPTVCSSQPPVAPAAETLTPSSGLCVHTCMHPGVCVCVCPGNMDWNHGHRLSAAQNNSPHLEHFMKHTLESKPFSFFSNFCSESPRKYYTPPSSLAHEKI